MGIKVKVPCNFDPESLKQEYPFDNLPTKQRSADYLYYAVGLIVTLQLKTDGWYDKHNGYISLCSQYIRQIHFEYKHFLQYLIDVGVLEADDLSIPGVKCFGFKFTSAYSGVELKEVELTNHILIGNMKQQKKKIEEERKNNVKPYVHIIRWYLKQKLEINKEAALSWVNTYFRQNFDNAEKYMIGDDLTEEKAILQNIKNRLLSFIEKVDSKSVSILDFKVDSDQGRRLHGMFSYMMKQLRHFFKYEGQNLVSVDIKNSQPYFSILLLDRQFWQSSAVRTSRLQLQELGDDMYKIKDLTGMRESIMMLDSSRTLTRLDVSTNLYKNLVVKGELYEYLWPALREKASVDFLEKWGERLSSRDSVKREMLRIMYCSNAVIQQPFYETSKDFENLFPPVGRIFKTVKQETESSIIWVNGRMKRVGYKRLPILLQRIESHLLLKVICKKIAKERPDVPTFTIHDSIVTTEENQAYVTEVIRQVLTEKVGFPPTLKPEEWRIENAYPVPDRKNEVHEMEKELQEFIYSI